VLALALRAVFSRRAAAAPPAGLLPLSAAAAPVARRAPPPRPVRVDQSRRQPPAVRMLLLLLRVHRQWSTVGWECFQHSIVEALCFYAQVVGTHRRPSSESSARTIPSQDCTGSRTDCNLEGWVNTRVRGGGRRWDGAEIPMRVRVGCAPGKRSFRNQRHHCAKSLLFRTWSMSPRTTAYPP